MASTTIMPVTAEAFVDKDISGDGYHAGFSYVFDDVDLAEDDFSMFTRATRTGLPILKMYSKAPTIE
jgi:hypothetical protein